MDGGAVGLWEGRRKRSRPGSTSDEEGGTRGTRTGVTPVYCTNEL